jgi:phage tail-like protein
MALNCPEFPFRLKWDDRYVASAKNVSTLEEGAAVVGYGKGDDSHNKLPTQQGLPITLERGITYDLEFEAWASTAGPDINATGKDIAIERFDSGGELIQAWMVYGCRVSGIEAESVPDSETIGKAFRRMTLRYERLELG